MHIYSERIEIVEMGLCVALDYSNSSAMYLNSC